MLIQVGEQQTAATDRTEGRRSHRFDLLGERVALLKSSSVSRLVRRRSILRAVARARAGAAAACSGSTSLVTRHFEKLVSQRRRVGPETNASISGPATLPRRSCLRPVEAPLAQSPRSSSPPLSASSPRGLAQEAEPECGARVPPSSALAAMTAWPVVAEPEKKSSTSESIASNACRICIMPASSRGASEWSKSTSTEAGPSARVACPSFPTSSRTSSNRLAYDLRPWSQIDLSHDPLHSVLSKTISPVGNHSSRPGRAAQRQPFSRRTDQFAHWRLEVIIVD